MNQVLADATTFLKDLVRTFRPQIKQARMTRGFDKPELSFSDRTQHIREGKWTCSPIPDVLKCRKVEITGPADRKMIINALNSGADVFMADLEDSFSPTEEAVLEGQINLRDAVDGTIEHYDEAKDKSYKLNPKTATLMVRPRGLHLDEAHWKVDGIIVPATLFDLGLFLYHNARNLHESGQGPFLYLPKLESHQEAAILDDVLRYCESKLGLPFGTIKVTVLIETLPAVFQMDEILWELRGRIVGLNCGRWDYIFSYIKCNGLDPSKIIPDRSAVNMEQPFMRAYAQLVIQTCHRRGVFAMGGMAAQIPLKNPEANELALAKVRDDKLREVKDGHDGTWVAHPGLIPLARKIFDEMEGDNQLHVLREDANVTAENLLEVPKGPLTEKMFRDNIRVTLQYLAAWLGGSGCVPLYGLMEDAATAEISRTQLWQQVHHEVVLDDGTRVDQSFFDKVLGEEVNALKTERGEDYCNSKEFTDAQVLLKVEVLSPVLTPFITKKAYERLTKTSRRR